LIDEGLVRGMAHITGGGIVENLPRCLPQDMGAVIERRSWTPQPIFSIIQNAGSIGDEEMYRVFNMGIGMCLICASEKAQTVTQRLTDAGEKAFVIGETQRGSSGVSFI
jgi:phosphoribosylformylglycinamidine cyclo-ligase